MKVEAVTKADESAAAGTGWRFVLRRDGFRQQLEQMFPDKKGRVGLRRLVAEMHGPDSVKGRNRAMLIARATYPLMTDDHLLARPYDLSYHKSLFAAVVTDLGHAQPGYGYTRVAPMVGGQVQPLAEEAIDLYDLSSRAGFEKSITALVELFARIVDLANRSLDGFRGRRVHLTIEEDAVAFTAMLYADRALYAADVDAGAAAIGATARSLPRGANADPTIDAAGAALANALFAARAARGENAAGIMRQLRLLSCE